MNAQNPPLAGMVLVTTWGWCCCRCGHEWVPRDWSREPKVCPKCKSPYWNTPRRSQAWAALPHSAGVA